MTDGRVNIWTGPRKPESRIFTSGDGAPFVEWMRAQGFDVNNTSASDVDVYLDKGTVSANVFRRDHEGKRVPSNCCSQAHFCTDEETRPILTPLPKEY